jgi:signal transduction histidine kinase
MSRFLPKTLFGRMMLIMIVGLVIAQALTTAIFFQERAHFGLRTAARHFGIQIAEILKIMDRLPVSQRPSIAEAISSSDLAVSISSTAVTATSDVSSNEEHVGIIAAGLRRYLGKERPLRVVVTDEAADEQNADESTPTVAKAILVQVGLGDDTWITFKSAIREPPNILTSSRFLLSMLVRLVTVIVLSLVAVRLATRPLQTLAAAAEELGRDIHRLPLKETGSVEVRRAASAFNTMQKRLIEYIQERTRILAAVSHDLKTPITRLRLRAELLDDPKVRAKFVNDLEEMEEMVSATLDFTRGLDNVEPRRNVDMMALLESLQADAQELGHEVTISGNVKQPAKADPHSLKRCLGNLLDNAWKYGKHVRISVEDSDQELRILVRDDGPGIPETEIEQVFEPFYRVEGSRNRATGGVGLGLSIARNAARANGGDLVLKNHPQGGLVATLRLPRTK